MSRCVLWGHARDRARTSARGAAVVEFALIMPILLILVFGIISYGYMLSFRQAISQAAAEGARAAAVAQRDADQQPDALKAINEALESYGVSCAGTSLTRNGAAAGSCSVSIGACEGDAAHQCVTARLSYDYDGNPLLPAPGMGLVLPDDLTYTAVARVS